jgi:hypothetical protein
LKVKDLIKMLELQDPEERVVMKNLQADPRERPHVYEQFRVYERDGDVVVDAYRKVYK